MLAASLVLPGSLSAQSVALSLGSIDAGVLRIDDLRLALADLRGGTANLTIAKLVVADQAWRNLTVRCERIDLTRDGVSCGKGEIAIPAADSQSKPWLIPLRFSWHGATGAFEAAIEPAAGEVWRLSSERTRGVRTTRLLLDRADVARFKPLTLALKDWQFGGTVSGEATIGRGPRETTLHANLTLDAGRFAEVTRRACRREDCRSAECRCAAAGTALDLAGRCRLVERRGLLGAFLSRIAGCLA